jgi:hypothetical protein
MGQQYHRVNATPKGRGGRAHHGNQLWEWRRVAGVIVLGAVPGNALEFFSFVYPDKVLDKKSVERLAR